MKKVKYNLAQNLWVKNNFNQIIQKSILSPKKPQEKCELKRPTLALVLFFFQKLQQKKALEQFKCF